MSSLILNNTSSPGTPASGKSAIYIGTDKLPVMVDDTGYNNHFLVSLQQPNIPANGLIPFYSRTGNGASINPTYVSGTSFTLAGDWTGILQKGYGVIVNISGLKYSYIVSVSYSAGTGLSTIVTSTWGDTAGAATTYTNGAVSASYFSPDPGLVFGFPGYIAYTTTWAAGGSMTFGTLTTSISKFRIWGNEVQLYLKAVGTTGGSAAANITATYPTNLTPDDTSNIYGNGAFLTDNGAPAGGICTCGTTLTFRRYNNANYTLAAGTAVGAKVEYLF